MADRLRFSRQEVGALTGFGLLLLVTASWWALAFWPTGESASLLARTRAVCFGAVGNGLPDGAGWLALLLQPAIMFALFLLILRDPFESALRRLLSGSSGRAGLGALAVVIFVGLTSVGVRVARASGEDGSSPDGSPTAIATTRVDWPAPPLDLVDQHGEQVSLQQFHGRPLLVTFAFGYCEAVCPTVVHDLLSVQRRVAELNPAVVVVSLDPWRDVPSRLPAIASRWRLGDSARVVSGTVAQVEAVLDAWKVPRARDQKTGDIVHQRLTYLVTREGQVAFATNGSVKDIAQLAREL